MSKILVNSRLSKGLRGYWPLNGNSLDTLGLNHGTNTNITYVPTNIGRGAYCNGVQFTSGSRIAIGTNSSFNFIHQTEIFSISFWVKFNNVATPNGLIMASTYPLVGTTPNGVGLLIICQPDGSLAIEVQITAASNTDGVYASTIAGAIPDNNFHHVVATVDRSTTTSKFYVDGNYVTTTDVGAWGVIAGDASILTLGAWMYAWGAYQFVLGGILDEVAIWDRVLSEYEVKRIYNDGRGFKLVTTNSLQNELVGYWPLNGNSVDSLGNNNGVDNNVSYVAGKIGSAAKIVGSSQITLGNLISATSGSINFWIYQDIAYQSYPVWELNGGYVTLIGTSNTYLIAFYSPTSLYFGMGPRLNNTWQMITMTWDGTTVKGYIDGVFQNSLGMNGTLTGFSTLQIHRLDVTTDFTVDEYGIWNRALNSDEILRLYNGGNGLNLA